MVILIFVSDVCKKCHWLQGKLQNRAGIEWRDASTIEKNKDFVSLAAICFAELDPHRLPLPILIDGYTVISGAINILRFIEKEE